MAKTRSPRRDSARRRLPLSVRLSLLVLFAALLPMAAVVGINDYLARPTLVNQGRQALTTDAQAKVNLVNRYLFERFSDGVALKSLPTTPAYLACLVASRLPYQQAAAINAQANCLDPVLGLDFYRGSNQRALCVGLVRDPNYMQWSLYLANGTPLLSYTPTGDPNNPCAESRNPPAPAKQDLQQVQQGQPFAGAVYYDAGTKSGYMNLYTPIKATGFDQPLGFLQARLRLDYIWGLVKSENGSNGDGSYAFITDQNNIRIASSKDEELFKATTQLDPSVSKTISDGKQFGSADPIQTLSLPSAFQYVQQQVHIDNPEKAFDPKAADTITLPWTYFVLSPNSTIELVANNQLRNTLLSAAIIAVLAILIGLLVGRGMARPVHTATEDLQGAAASLKVLAARQESSAGEQQWVVDACKTGLDSVRYLSDAMNQAAKRIIDASNWFGEYWDRLTEEQARRTVQHLQELARYIDEAAHRQSVSSDRLGKAITVTTQVSEQLVSGASAAKQSSDQLDQVVGNLQHVVGGRPPALAPAPEQDDELDVMGRIAVSPAPMRSGRSGRLQMPAAQSQMRQLPAPVHAGPMSGPGRSGPGRSQVAESWQAGGYAPQAPYGPYAGARRPGQSQMFDGGGPSYPGADAGGGYGNGYGQEQQPAGRRANNGSRAEWDW